MYTLSICIQYNTWSLREIRQLKEMKGIQIVKGEIKVSLAEDDTYMTLKSPPENAFCWQTLSEEHTKIISLPICKRQTDSKRNQGNNMFYNILKNKLSWGSSKQILDTEETIRR